MNPDQNQDTPWYPNGSPIPGKSQGTQQPPFPPVPTAQHGQPPGQRYTPPTRPTEAAAQQPYLPGGMQSPGYPQPQQQQPAQPQYSIDYLNQIAPAAKKPGLDNRLFLFIIGGGLVLAAIVGMLTLLSGGSGPTEKMQLLAARLETLQKVADDSQKNIKSNKLRSTNSSLTVFLTNADHDIIDPLAANNVDVKKIDKKITDDEKTKLDDLEKKLDDARLNAVFDRTYAREMSFQLTTLESQMETLYKASKSKKLKDFLEKTDGNITPIIKQLDGFNTTTAND